MQPLQGVPGVAHVGGDGGAVAVRRVVGRPERRVEARGEDVVPLDLGVPAAEQAPGDGGGGGGGGGVGIGMGGHHDRAKLLLIRHTESMNSDTSVMVKPGLRMRDLCARTGATPRMIRHYEKTGILAPGRESNGYRVFTEEDVRTVADARCLIEAGLSATETAELVGIVCGEGVAIPIRIVG